ncbi:MAG: hypothetical protein ABJC24_08005, partial [Chloroflexota bacterium]
MGDHEVIDGEGEGQQRGGKDARKDEKGNFLVAITVNSSLKLLLFSADGTFLKEAEMKFGHVPGDST